MSLCLLSDSWIPVIRNGESVVIRPDQIAEPNVSKLAWSRADLNLACIELLIGLFSMTDPPESDTEWKSRFHQPDAGRLRDALAPFAPYFALAGDGPRFLQDLDAFENEAESSDIKPADMLHIDSAGEATESKNADLMVKRGRFPSLPLGEAAMALYTLQAFAPTGGKGNRTSMRGGGPMTVLVRPRDETETRFPLWQLVFSNVLPGSPLAAENAQEALPWLRPTRASENGEITTPEDVHPLEAFFGMPRRLRLVIKDSLVVGVVQRPYGTNYKAWEHPLTPYYRKTEADPEWFPVRSKPGRVSYRNWMGVTMKPAGEGNGTRRLARAVREYSSRLKPPDFELMVGGWAMDNMKPLDFLLDTYPGFRGIDEDNAEQLDRLVVASNIASAALCKALKDACRLDGTSANTVVEIFFSETEGAFEESVHHVINNTGGDVKEAWYGVLRNQARRMFDERVLDGLLDHDIKAIERRVIAKRNLLATLAKKVRRELDLPVSDRKEKRP